MTDTIIHCTTDAQREAACLLLESLYPHQPPSYVRDGMEAMRHEGWEIIGIFDGERCIATIFYRIGMRLFFGKMMQLDSLYIDPAFRRRKLGEKIFQWVEQKAREEECRRIILESTSENFTGHQFFYKQGYFVRGFVLVKPLDGTMP
jgi:GNAT superfamily N-acetyltransferase